MGEDGEGPELLEEEVEDEEVLLEVEEEEVWEEGDGNVMVCVLESLQELGGVEVGVELHDEP